MNAVKIIRGAEIGSERHLVLMKVKWYGKAQARKYIGKAKQTEERKVDN